MRTLRYTLCDVFTSRPLTGNALAVFTGAGNLPDATLQAIAREMNLSETVFVYPGSQGVQAKLRIFTPGRELPFAGHPIIGAAAVVGRAVLMDPLRFETGAGTIEVAVERQGAEVRSATLVTPTPRVAPWSETQSLLAAVGVREAALPIEIYDLGPRHLMVALDDVAQVRGLQPDLSALARVHDEGVAVFARSGAGIEARVFVPGLGVPEDPATGSAAGPIAAHAARHGWLPWGASVEIAQGEAIGRPSRLWARVEGEGDAIRRVEVSGEVILVGRGELRLPA